LNKLPAVPYGFINIDKPLHLTSHDVVSRVRRKLSIKKVGHSGTLDPLASGVLVVCVGQATRLSEYVMGSRKRYRACIKLGETTATYDAEGAVLTYTDPTAITMAEIQAQLSAFTGDIQQLPPMYSAVKMNGKKLYELAREGESIERQFRAVTIYSLTIESFENPLLTLSVHCGSGTYIRSLAHDLGQTLGVGAHLCGLVRTQSGAFNLEQAVALETFMESNEPTRYIIPPSPNSLPLPHLTLDARAIERVKNGQAICADLPLDNQVVIAFDQDDRLIAVLQADEGNLKPNKVFTSQ
jgi:tRNA pseudouridine55 synthase